MKNIFTRYKILVCSLSFTFRTLKTFLNLFFCMILRFLSLQLFLSSLIMIELGVVFFMFLVLEFYWPSWICGLSSNLESFQALFFENVFPTLPSGTPIICMLGFCLQFIDAAYIFVSSCVSFEILPIALSCYLLIFYSVMLICH